MLEYDVAVVGAGAAGLLAARDLARAGHSVVLLEARDRPGGRMFERTDARALAPIELGAEFVHGRPSITYRLLHELGIAVVDNAETGFVYRDGTLHAADDETFSRVADVLAKALEVDGDRTIERLLAECASTPDMRDVADWTRRLVAGFDAADPALASARAMASEWAGDASAGGAQSRPIGGYAPLTAHLARSLDPERVDVRFSTIAKHIARTPAGVTVTARCGERERSYGVRHVVVTIPHGVLAASQDAEAAIAFDPPLPAETLHAIDRIAMGPVVKVVLRFGDAFWEASNGGAWRDGAFFNGDGAFPTLWTQLPTRANILLAWAGGPAAVRLHDATERERVELALACAGRMFGDADAAGRAFENGYTHDWQRDPFALGAYTYVLCGGEDAREALGVPVDGKLWFAGEATATDGEGGTVAGALQSGARAARGVIAALAP